MKKNLIYVSTLTLAFAIGFGLFPSYKDFPFSSIPSYRPLSAISENIDEKE